MSDDTLLATLLSQIELKAASFIVTVYGDVVVPRGGVLWTGTLVEICSLVGISESRVRTSVSRLVAANNLQGERDGRRSYYRLDASARKEFEEVAALLYAREVASQGWQIIHAPDLPEEQARDMRLGHMGGNVYIRPDRGQEPPSEAIVVFHASEPVVATDLARYWDLSAVQYRYQQILTAFAQILEAARRDTLSDATALAVRLLLVEAYRKVLLRDPRLPANALPQDWAGNAARDLFRHLYAALSPGAERHIANRLRGTEGYLPAKTAESDRRLGGLSNHK